MFVCIHFLKDFLCHYWSICIPICSVFICVLRPIIYFSDNGTIFYKAKRIGQGGKTFRMYKFGSVTFSVSNSH